MQYSSSIVVVMADQHRGDVMGCAGDDGVLTPNLDSLAREGVRFSRVTCQGPLCMPARASFMTETYVRDHGVYTNWAEIAPDSPTYAWALREAGYHTTLLGKAHLYRDEIHTATHIDDLAQEVLVRNASLQMTTYLGIDAKAGGSPSWSASGTPPS